MTTDDGLKGLTDAQWVSLFIEMIKADDRDSEITIGNAARAWLAANVHDSGDVPLDRGKVMAGANLFAAAYNLVDLIEGISGLGQRWTNGSGFRLKDTGQWVEFYVAVKSFQDRGEAKAILAGKGEV